MTTRDISQQEVKQPRIKNGVRPTGDDGKTSLINGERIPKSHKVIRVFGCLERLSNDLQLFVYEYGTLSEDKTKNEIEEEDLELLTWLIVNMNNLGSFCYWKGEKDQFCFPETILDFMDKRLDYFQSKIEDCKDFLIFTERKNIYLDRCKIDARELESAYWTWYEYCYGKQPICGNLSLMASILNRLSGYIWNMNRYLMFKDAIDETHWSGGVTKFK